MTQGKQTNLMKNKRAAMKLPRLFEIGSDQGFPIKTRTLLRNGIFENKWELHEAVHGTPTVVKRYPRRNYVTTI
jgi:hypothetical protein